MNLFKEKDIAAAAGLYALYFGVMGVMLPYFNLYCHRIGFSGTQIGIISAARSFVFIILPVLWGIAADRTGMQRPIFWACNFISVVIWSAFLVLDDFIGMTLAIICYAVFYSPIISFLETFTMQILQNGGENRSPQDYGKIRAWGSAAFIMVSLVAGRLIDMSSAAIVIWLILCLSMLRALVSTRIPRIKAPKSPSLKQAARLLTERQMAVFLIAAFLMLASHGAYYGFFSIYLEALGFDGGFIGMAWAVAVICEIILMQGSKTLFGRFSYENVLIFSFGVAALRWAGLFFAKSAIAILLLQILHSVTYGAFHMASILYVDKLSPATSKTLGQALNNAMSYGLGLMIGTFLSGLFYESHGPWIFAACSLTALAGGLLLVIQFKIGK